MTNSTVVLGYNLPFGEAIREMNKRKVVLPDKYYGELQGLARQLSFSVAGLASHDQLDQVKSSLTQALKNGESFNKWKKDILASGNLDFPDHRLDNIFRTNIQNSYNRGSWQKSQDTKDLFPFVMYDAVDDSRVRPTHMALDGIIKRIDDPFWDEHAPSNGYRCRCKLITLSAEDAEEFGGVTSDKINLESVKPDKGWNYNPGKDAEKGIKKAIKERQPSPLKDILIKKIENQSILFDNLQMKNIHRSTWSKAFPLTDIYAKENKVKLHPSYDQAKTGDINKALDLIKDTISHSKIKSLNGFRSLDPVILPVMGIEDVSDNVIPNVLAMFIADEMRFDFNDDIMQTSKAGHTGANGWWRLVSQASFAGDVIIGANYILVDDFIGMGGTFANLKGYIESRGGNVIKTLTLTGKPRSSKLALNTDTLNKLRKKHGEELELWWWQLFGTGFAELTEAEANYLIRAESADSIRNKIIQAAQQTNQ